MEFGSIIWIVLIGGMFYLMMKGGGCCGEGSHSKKEGRDLEGNDKTGEHGTGTESEHKTGCH